MVLFETSRWCGFPYDTVAIGILTLPIAFVQTYEVTPALAHISYDPVGSILFSEERMYVLFGNSLKTKPVHPCGKLIEI